MKLRRLTLGLAICMGCVRAQSGDALEIRGFVIETGLVFGVAGAQVTLFEFGADPPHATERTAIAAVSTDSNGAFQFHPAHFGTYYVEVKKEGYFAKSFSGPTVAPAGSTGDILTLDRDHRSREFRFSLMRMGEIRGRVIDEEGKPLAGARVVVHAVSADWLVSVRVVSGKDGDFVAEKLTPGEYLVRILPQHAGLPEIVPQFSDSDVEVVDRDLEASEWPGGSEERNAIPLSVRSGATLSVGTIIARIVPYYRVRVSTLSGDCAPGENWDFAALPASTPTGFALPMKVPCGKDFLIRNLRPGSYQFSLSNGQKAGKYEWALASVDVTKANFKIDLTMSPGMDMRGQMLAAEGSALPPPGKIAILLRPGPAVALGGSAKPNPAGSFLLQGLDGTRRRVHVEGLGSQYYVKEIRYGGVVARDGFITPAPGAILEIVVDDKPATLTGTVTGVDKPGGRAVVMAVEWPVVRDQDGTFPFLSSEATGEQQGRFRIGLAPGEYRVLALPPGGIARFNMDTFIRLQDSAETVKLDRGGLQDVSLKLAEP